MVRKSGWILLAVLVQAGAAQAQTLFQRSWGLQAKSGIDAPKAWSQMKRDCDHSGVVVAVIDTGIDMNHPALKNILWTNPAEARGKARQDDDNDGFVDDLHGWDFATNSGRLVDHHGHGTHIAGIIAGRESNPGGFKGVCPGVRIMALRYYDEKANGADNLRNTVKAINYAVDHGADIINYSGGGADFAAAEYQALKRAEQKGILVVAAAGNERSDADEKPYYPAAYKLSNIISVTAIDERGQILSSANWGLTRVHVAAPGSSILSSLPNGGYGFMSGTSQATAFVSGVAALLLSENRSLGFRQIRTLIEESSMRYPNLVAKIKTGGRVNAAAALIRLNKSARQISSQE